MARAIDAFVSAARGSTSERVLVVSADDPAFAMPAAAWAAKSGDTILFTHKDSLPAETIAAIKDHTRPRIYVLGPSTIIKPKVTAELRKLGPVMRMGGPDPETQLDRVRALHRRPVRLGRRRPRARPRVRPCRRRPGAGGRGLSRCPRAARMVRCCCSVRVDALTKPMAAVPARHPARLCERPGARGLQSRLADRGRERHHSRAAVDDRPIPGDRARRRQGLERNS